MSQKANVEEEIKLIRKIIRKGSEIKYPSWTHHYYNKYGAMEGMLRAKLDAYKKVVKELT